MRWHDPRIHIFCAAEGVDELELIEKHFNLGGIS
jgi:hypothetical protein